MAFLSDQDQRPHMPARCPAYRSANQDPIEGYCPKWVQAVLHIFADMGPIFVNIDVQKVVHSCQLSGAQIFLSYSCPWCPSCDRTGSTQGLTSTYFWYFFELAPMYAVRIQEVRSSLSGRRVLVLVLMMMMLMMMMLMLLLFEKGAKVVVCLPSSCCCLPSLVNLALCLGYFASQPPHRSQAARPGREGHARSLFAVRRRGG